MKEIMLSIYKEIVFLAKKTRPQLGEAGSLNTTVENANPRHLSSASLEFVFFRFNSFGNRTLLALVKSQVYDNWPLLHSGLEITDLRVKVHC